VGGREVIRVLLVDQELVRTGLRAGLRREGST
jgi:hypothetical protein